MSYIYVIPFLKRYALRPCFALTGITGGSAGGAIDSTVLANTAPGLVT